MHLNKASNANFSVWLCLLGTDGQKQSFLITQANTIAITTITHSFSLIVCYIRAKRGPGCLMNTNSRLSSNYCCSTDFPPQAFILQSTAGTRVASYAVLAWQTCMPCAFAGVSRAHAHCSSWFLLSCSWWLIFAGLSWQRRRWKTFIYCETRIALSSVKNQRLEQPGLTLNTQHCVKPRLNEGGARDQHQIRFPHEWQLCIKLRLICSHPDQSHWALKHQKWLGKKTAVNWSHGFIGALCMSLYSKDFLVIASLTVLTFNRFLCCCNKLFSTYSAEIHSTVHEIVPQVPEKSKPHICPFDYRWQINLKAIIFIQWRPCCWR